MRALAQIQNLILAVDLPAEVEVVAIVTAEVAVKAEAKMTTISLARRNPDLSALLQQEQVVRTNVGSVLEYPGYSATSKDAFFVYNSLRCAVCNST